MQKNNLENLLKGRGEQEAKKILEAEGRRLERIAKKIWREYIESYSPKKYVRTQKSERGIKLGRVKRVDGNHLGIEVTFENDLMYHDSVVEGSRKKGHSIMLISDGWHAKKLEKQYGKRVYRHTYFEGIDYIGKVQRAYNAGKPAGITLEVQWSGIYYK